MNFKRKDCIFHMPQRLAGMNERVDNSCKRSTFVAPSSLSAESVVSGRHPLSGKVGVPRRSWCNGADFTGVSKFPEILGKLSMHKQCVPGLFSPTHEPGNEATVPEVLI